MARMTARSCPTARTSMPKAEPLALPAKTTLMPWSKPDHRRSDFWFATASVKPQAHSPSRLLLVLADDVAPQKGRHVEPPGEQPYLVLVNRNNDDVSTAARPTAKCGPVANWPPCVAFDGDAEGA